MLSMHVLGDVVQAMITGLLMMMLVAFIVTLAIWLWAKWGPGSKTLSLVGAIKKRAVHSEVVVGIRSWGWSGHHMCEITSCKLEVFKEPG